MVSDTMQSLSNFDAALARSVVNTDFQLDAMQRLAEVLRSGFQATLSASGDLAKSIAKRVTNISPDLRMPRCIIGLRTMHELGAHH